MKRLANNNNVDAQSMLASLYLKGQGVEADRDQAIYWFEKAAKNGDAKAIEFMKSQRGLAE